MAPDHAPVSCRQCGNADVTLRLMELRSASGQLFVDQEGRHLFLQAEDADVDVEQRQAEVQCDGCGWTWGLDVPLPEISLS